MIKKCPNGHLYDGENYSKCPFCEALDIEKKNDSKDAFEEFFQESDVVTDDIIDWEPNPILQETIEPYREIYNKITQMLMNAISQVQPKTNMITSSLSSIMLLGMLAEATEGETKEEITSVISRKMNYSNFKDILYMLSSKYVDRSFGQYSQKKNSLMIANAICVKNTYQSSIKTEYLDYLNYLFKGELFSSNDFVRDVNRWVNKKTRGMIKNIVDPSMIANCVAVLVNAIAFEAKWKDEYENAAIHEERFHNVDGSCSWVKMMDSCETEYIENDEFIGFLKPYKDPQYKFMALLPKVKCRKIPFQVMPVEKIDFLRMYQEAINTEVEVTMPEFQSDLELDLSQIFQNWGIRKAFSSQADFSPMSNMWLKVNKILQKAYIEVDRKGTKAAVVEIAYIGEGAIPPPDKKVCLDRPFAYAIIDVELGLPIFSGIYYIAKKR